ncbi:MAG: septum formation initiator family protein [Ruminococcaceae bacterium]|nr:septum formation initiator family protein [Oscillospiraceae bacterium]
MAKRQKKQKQEKSKMTRALWAVVFLYVGYIFVQQQIRLHDLRVEEKEVSAEIEQAQQENKELTHVMDIMDTDEYIEKVARQKLGFVKPDEQVFIDTSK